MGKLIVTFLDSAMAMGVMAETVNTVTVTKFNQSYPYTGKATVEYTVGGTPSANAVAEFTINTDNASAPRALADHRAAPLALALATLALATFPHWQHSQARPRLLRTLPKNAILTPS